MSLICSFVLWLFCGIIFALTIVLGTGCGVLVEDNLEPLQVYLQKINATNIIDLLDIVDECGAKENFNIFDELERFNLDIPNFNQLIDERLQDVNYESQINKINISDSFSLPGNFGDIKNKVDSFNLSSINLSSLKNLTFTNELSRYLSNLKNGTLALNASITPITVITQGSPTNQEVDGAIAIYYQNITAIIAIIDTMNSTNLPNLKVKVNNIASGADSAIISVNASVNAVKDLIKVKDNVMEASNYFISFIKSYLIDETVPQVFDEIRHFAGNASSAIRYIGQCKRFGDSVAAMENSICVRLT